MKLKYRIIEAQPESHSIIVRFWTDKLSEEALASQPEKRADGSPLRCRSDVSISVPIPEPAAGELDKLILRYAPINGLRDIEAVLDDNIDTSMSNVLPLVGVTKEHIIIVEDVPTDEDIEAIVQSLGDK